MNPQRIDFKVLQQEILNRQVESWLNNKDNKDTREELLRKLPAPHLMNLLTSPKFRPLYEPNKYWHDGEHPVNMGIGFRLDLPKSKIVEIKIEVAFELMSDVTAYQGGTPHSPSDNSSPALCYSISNGVIYEKGERDDATQKLVQSALEAYETGFPNPEVSLFLEVSKSPLDLTIDPVEVTEGRLSRGGFGWYTSIDARPLDESGNLILYCSTNNFAFNYTDFVVRMRSDDIKLIDHLYFF